MNRRTWLQVLSVLAAARGYSQSPATSPTTPAPQGGRGPQQPMRVTKEQIQAALKLLGLEFQDAEIDMMLPNVNRALGGYENTRKIEVPYDTEPAFTFHPGLP